MGSARPVRGAKLAVGHPRGGRGFGAVQFLGSPGAAEAGSVPRGPRQRVRVVVVVVMPGLVPGIHVLTSLQQERRGWPGHPARRRAEPVIGPRFARTRWRFCPAMTSRWMIENHEASVFTSSRV